VGGSVYLHEDNVFATMLGKLPQSESESYLYVVSSQGELIYHPQKERIGQSVIGNEAVQLVMQGMSGGKKVTNMNHVDMLAGYAAVKESGWGIIAQTPESFVIDAA